MSKDREFILELRNWPQFPILPLIRQGSVMGDKGRYGFIHAGDVAEQRFTVYLATIYDIKDGEVFSEQVAGLPIENIEGIDNLLRVWRVD